MTLQTRAVPRRFGKLSRMAVWGPGLLVMLADTDAGNIVSAAQAGAQWRYRLLALPLLLIPMLFVVQALSVRLGLSCGQGFGALIRGRLGRGWAWLALAALAVATIGSLATEFDGIAGVGELYGAPRWITVSLAAICLLIVVRGGSYGSYGSIERLAIVIGLFELAFFAVAWAAHPSSSDMALDLGRQRFGEPGYLYLGAALIGATFNPWMIFYQPSALIAKGLGPADHRPALWDTAIGAVLTQLVTAAVLIATAATLGRAASGGTGLSSVGEISRALTPFLGHTAGRLVFGVGVVGASLVAAIVCSLALSWGIADIAGPRFCRPALLAGIVGSAVVVVASRDLVGLALATQVLNAVMIPVLVGLLIVLAALVLPLPIRLRGMRLGVVVAVCALVSLAGLIGAWAGFA